MLGKRPRPSMRRTTSLSELPPETSDVAPPDHSDPHRFGERRREAAAVAEDGTRKVPRWHSVDLAAVETARFLASCGLCNRRLGAGLDTFMYRGEVAFCSLECREHWMKQDERMQKFSPPSMKATEASNAKPGSEAPNKAETVVS